MFIIVYFLKLIHVYWMFDSRTQFYIMAHLKLRGLLISICLSFRDCLCFKTEKLKIGKVVFVCFCKPFAYAF